MDFSATVSGYRVPLSHMTSTYLLPEWLLGNGPTMSIAIQLNGSSFTGKGEHSNLADIKDLPNFVEITTKPKATVVHKPIVVAGGKTKQDVIIADATSTAPVTLWEGNRLIEGPTYYFTNLLVRTFQLRQKACLHQSMSRLRRMRTSLT